MRLPRSGFTLVEVLLVLAILAIVTVIVMPTFVHSIRGNRLRTAARTVTMAGRYARSMALLQGREMTVTFDLEKSTVVIGPAGSAARDSASETKVAGFRDEAPAFESASGSGTVVRAEVETITRALDQVKIAAVSVGDRGSVDVSDGSCEVVYRSNGLCTPYRVTLVDSYGGSVGIDVDALGTVAAADK